MYEFLTTVEQLKERKVLTSKNPVCLDKISSMQLVEFQDKFPQKTIAAFQLPDFSNNFF